MEKGLIIGNETFLLLVNMKNAVEIFQFSCTYNARQLLEYTCEFIALNLAYFLESRYNSIFERKYSIMNQVKFVEDSLQKFEGLWSA